MMENPIKHTPLHCEIAYPHSHCRSLLATMVRLERMGWLADHDIFISYWLFAGDDHSIRINQANQAMQPMGKMVVYAAMWGPPYVIFVSLVSPRCTLSLNGDINQQIQ